ncbi:MAG: response regulator transcription factor, partial [Planctomycetota bacterium]
MALPTDTSSSTLVTRVLCVDDNADITEVMRMVIDTEPTMRCVGCLASADHLVEKVRRMSPLPEVVLLDATMPGKSPLVAMSELAAAFPEIRTIIYSGHDDPGFMEQAREAGAWGCVSKNDDPSAILHAVRRVTTGNALWA